MAKPETQALLDELAAPTHCDRAKVTSVRRQVAPLVESLQLQSARMLKLHADFVDADEDDALVPMQEELRQKGLAVRRLATELEEKAHAVYEAMLDCERFAQRFLAAAERKGLRPAALEQRPNV